VRLSDPALDRSVFSERVREYVPFPLGLAGLLVGFAIRDFKLELHSPFFVCAARYSGWPSSEPQTRYGNWRPQGAFDAFICRWGETP
jgi:hypothetical protein